MIELKRRIELEDIVKNKDVWRKVVKNIPCWFKAKYGQKFYATKKGDKIIIKSEDFEIEVIV